MSRNKRPLPSSIRDVLTTPSTTTLGPFDPWNSVSTGHQRAESSNSRTSGWQQVLSEKLGKQFGDKTGRGGCGNREGDWEWVSSEQYEDVRRREERIGDIRSFMGGVKKRRLDLGGRTEAKQIDVNDEIHCGIIKGNGAFVLDDSESEGDKDHPAVCQDQVHNTSYTSDNPKRGDEPAETRTPATRESETGISSSAPKPIQSNIHTTSRPASSKPTAKGIFSNLTIYVNGSTYPLISDHKLKQLLVSNGANVTFALARRTATHVILGRPNNNRNGNGAGGGLAATKLQREIQRVGGKGVKFVGVEWVLESIKVGCRLPEARFATLHMAPDKQRSVMSMFQRES
ncbi:BRCA1 C-terminus domain-containing protein [Blastomyces dermatitidis ATCC 18188]|uniref:BRCA1 C-terminus domain-containing protein n=1 Tax=Ajellomyces dermatitidis (strain ATCC 18188 / CBS 674.68) TaxID=653446 RepID=F2TF33_AJEDA|nr:BRCA1 C-terminus domain-containing protein [Blastomyces dermatitidis ATCC 18188]